MPHLQHRAASGARALLAAGLLAMAAALTVASAADSAAAAGAPEGAQWVTKKVFFVYAGIQTQYGCDGFRDQMRKVLLQLGARKSDLDVRETGCGPGLNQATHSTGVSGTMSVLEPVQLAQGDSANRGAGAVAASAGPGVVAAHWQAVQVRLDPPGRDVNGQCELLQQIKSHILPLFATRNVQYDPVCSPRALLVGPTSLRLEVLTVDHTSDVARE